MNKKKLFAHFHHVTKWFNWYFSFALRTFGFVSLDETKNPKRKINCTHKHTYHQHWVIEWNVLRHGIAGGRKRVRSWALVESKKRTIFEDRKFVHAYHPNPNCLCTLRKVFSYSFVIHNFFRFSLALALSFFTFHFFVKRVFIRRFILCAYYDCYYYKHAFDIMLMALRQVDWIFFVAVVLVAVWYCCCCFCCCCHWWWCYLLCASSVCAIENASPGLQAPLSWRTVVPRVTIINRILCVISNILYIRGISDQTNSIYNWVLGIYRSVHLLIISFFHPFLNKITLIL